MSIATRAVAVSGAGALLVSLLVGPAVGTADASGAVYWTGTLSVEVVRHDVVTPPTGGGVSYPVDVRMNVSGVLSTPVPHPRAGTTDPLTSVFTVQSLTGEAHNPSVVFPTDLATYCKSDAVYGPVLAYNEIDLSVVGAAAPTLVGADFSGARTGIGFQVTDTSQCPDWLTPVTEIGEGGWPTEEFFTCLGDLGGGGVVIEDAALPPVVRQSDGSLRIQGSRTMTCDGAQFDSTKRVGQQTYTADLVGHPAVPPTPSATDDPDSCDDNRPPRAAFTAIPLDWREGRASRRPGVQLGFTSTSSDSDHGTSRLRHKWSFVAGPTTFASGPLVRLRWSTADHMADARTAILTVIDPCGARSSARVSMKITGNPNRDFAPIAKIHPEEKFFPASPRAFVISAELWFARKGKNKLITSEPTARRLGSGGYSFRRLGARLTSDDLTRPHLSGNVGPTKTGFYLELPDHLRVGQRPGAERIRTPMYRQDVGRKRVYWLFYNYSKATLRYGNGVPLVAHEGDWERIIVDLNDQKVPSRVGYVAHHEPVGWLPYIGLTSGKAPEGGLRTQGLNPLGYVTRLGHGTWPEPGRHRVCVVYLVKCGTDFTADGGWDWDGSTHQVALRSAGWFGRPADHARCRTGAPSPAGHLRCGFGGAWGHAGKLGDSTGPLGPSAYKLATENG